jgi:flagellar hook-length control protein FliK
VKGANASDSTSQLPFNQLLAGNMGKASHLQADTCTPSDADALALLNEEAGDGLNVLAQNLASGKDLPLTSPVSAASTALAGGADGLDAEHSVVGWQQVQIDWSRTQLGAAMSIDDNNALSGGNRGQQAVDQLLLQQAKLLQSENQGKAPMLLAATQPALTPQTTGFAAALQGAVAVGEGLMQSKGQKLESLNVDVELGELAAMSQLKDGLNSASGNVSRAPVALTMSQSLVDNPGWGQAMAARIGMMMNNGVHTATMQLNPAELGSIHIQLSMQGDSTSVQFQTQNGDTSDLIEKMLPRLNSSLEQQGLRLDEVKVSHNPNLGNGAAANSNQQFAGESAGQRDLNGRAANADLASSDKRDDELGNQADVLAASDGRLAVDYYA